LTHLHRKFGLKDPSALELLAVRIAEVVNKDFLGQSDRPTEAFAAQRRSIAQPFVDGLDQFDGGGG
jgi:hypothetical protein